MNQMIRKDKAGAVLVALPRDIPPASITAQFYNKEGVAQWSPIHTVDHPSWALSTQADANEYGFALTAFGTDRVPQPGELLFLAAASSPEAGVRESVIVDRVDTLQVYVRESLRLTWPVGAVVVPAEVRVPLTALDTADVGRACRIEMEVTYSDLPDDEATEFSTALADIVSHVPRNTLTYDVLHRTYPNQISRLAGDLEQNDGGWGERMERAFELVLMDVNRRITPDFIYSDRDLERLTIARLLLLAAENGSLYEDADQLSTIRLEQEAYDRVYTETLSNMGWVDRNDDQVPDEEEQNVSLIRRVYMVT